MTQRPLHTGADLGVVVRIGEHPLRGPLEHGQVLDLPGDGRRYLESAGSRADQRHALAAQVYRVVPLGGVKSRSAEQFLARDRGEMRPVELPDRTDDRPRRQRRRRAVAIPGPNGPSAAGVVPGRLGDLGFPQHVPADVVAVHDALEVALQLGLLGEEVRPRIRRLEAVAVEMVADVNPCTGIGVLPPCSADPGVLLDDRERNAGLLEPNSGQQPRFSASDD